MIDKTPNKLSNSNSNSTIYCEQTNQAEQRYYINLFERHIDTIAVDLYTRLVSRVPGKFLNQAQNLVFLTLVTFFSEMV